jgi:hypothetical protein
LAVFAEEVELLRKTIYDAIKLGGGQTYPFGDSILLGNRWKHDPDLFEITKADARTSGLNSDLLDECASVSGVEDQDEILGRAVMENLQSNNILRDDARWFVGWIDARITRGISHFRHNNVAAINAAHIQLCSLLLGHTNRALSGIAVRRDVSDVDDRNAFASQFIS